MTRHAEKLIAGCGTLAASLAVATVLLTTPRTEPVSAFEYAAPTSSAALQSRMTIIHKDPDGPWPGGKLWIGKAVKTVQVGGHRAEVETPLVIATDEGIEI